MKVVLMHRTIAKHDAIGNDIFHMYQIIGHKYECYVYCDYLVGFNINNIDKNRLAEIISNEANLVIYHHSVYWQDGEALLKKCKAKLMFKYHNITPHAYFEAYNEDYRNQCAKGREQTQKLFETYKSALWVCDSEYNTLDLPLGQKTVLPPFNNIELWKGITPEETLLKNLIQSEKINLLFVGRVAPNKGHKHLLMLISHYIENYGNDICLYIIGKKDEALVKYNCELDHIIHTLKLEDNIKFIGEINDHTLISYYLGCDFFVICSEHEGFCVPLLEAQYLHLPVIAMASSAIGETLGNHQVVLGKNANEFSAAIKVLHENLEYRNYLIDYGFRNYQDRFSNDKLVKAFKQVITDFTGEEI